MERSRIDHDVIRVLIVDDQSLFAQSLKTLLDTYTDDIEVVHIAENGKEAVDTIGSFHPDVTLMDVKMPVMNGVEATRRIMKQNPQMQILMLSTFDEVQYVNEALQFGAMGYLLKDITPMELIVSIRAAMQGVTQISPSVAKRLIDHKFESSVVQSGAYEWFTTLTDREKEVFKLVAKGYDNHEIADELHIAYQTVRNYVSLIYSKLGVQDRFQIIKHAQKLLQ